MDGLSKVKILAIINGSSLGFVREVIKRKISSEITLKPMTTEPSLIVSTIATATMFSNFAVSISVEDPKIPIVWGDLKKYNIIFMDYSLLQMQTYCIENNIELIESSYDTLETSIKNYLTDH